MSRHGGEITGFPAVFAPGNWVSGRTWNIPMSRAVKIIHPTFRFRYVNSWIRDNFLDSGVKEEFLAPPFPSVGVRLRAGLTPGFDFFHGL